MYDHHKILLMVTIDNLIYCIKTDHLTDVRLQISVRDSSNVLLYNGLVPMKDGHDKMPWYKCSGFYWSFLDYVKHYFPPKVKDRLDSLFKLKAFL